MKFVCVFSCCACFNESDKGEGGETKRCGSERPRFSGCDVGGGKSCFLLLCKNINHQKGNSHDMRTRDKRGRKQINNY